MIPASHRASALVLLGALLGVAHLAISSEQIQAQSGDPRPSVESAGAGDREDLLVEGFETSWPPAGWVEINTHPNNWRRTNYIAHGGTYSATCSWSAAVQDEYLVTQALDFSTAINPKLEFFEDQVDWSLGYHHYIMVSTTSQTNPAAFTVVQDWTPGNHTINGFSGEATTVSLYQYAGQSTVYVAFRYRGTPASSDTWYIDDVRVYNPGAHDVACTGVLPDGAQIEGGTLVTPRAVVENIGSTVESFNVQMQISQAGSPVYSEVAGVSNLQPGNVTTVDFPGFTAATGQYFDLTGSTLLGSDGNANNDVSTGRFDTYDNPHVPLGILFTNSGCIPCIAANQALDAYMPGAGNSVALLRVHVWWPWGGDVIYLANTPQANSLVDEFDVIGVPHFFVDAFYWNVEHTAADMTAAFNVARTWKSPCTMELSWNDQMDELTVTVHVNNAMQPGDYRLFTAITEDHIDHLGPNGEPQHQQAFRRMYPDVETGISVPTTPGDHSFVVPCPLNGAWDYDELRASAYLRDMNDGRAWQAVTRFLTEIEGNTSAEDPEAYPFELAGNYPNPFNPKTSIRYSLDVAGRVSLAVYALDGRLVKTLVDAGQSAGAHEQVWDGRDESGQAVASGIYLYRLESGGRSLMQKMLLLK